MKYANSQIIYFRFHFNDLLHLLCLRHNKQDAVLQQRNKHTSTQYTNLNFCSHLSQKEPM
jgi:hypothetical protein